MPDFRYARFFLALRTKPCYNEPPDGENRLIHITCFRKKRHETKRSYKPNPHQLGRHAAGGLFCRLEHPAGGVSRCGTASLPGSAGGILCRTRRLLRPPGRLLCAARRLLRAARARGAGGGRGRDGRRRRIRRRRIRRRIRRRCRGRAGGGRGGYLLCPRGCACRPASAGGEAEKEEAPPQGRLSPLSCHARAARGHCGGARRQGAGAKPG